MGSGGDNELPSDRVTEPIRIYRGDKAIIMRIARSKQAELNRKVTPADVVRGLLASVQRQERERESGS